MPGKVSRGHHLGRDGHEHQIFAGKDFYRILLMEKSNNVCKSMKRNISYEILA